MFRERYRELHGLAYRLLGDHGEAEDVVQETFLRLDGQAVLDRPDGEVAAWLRRVCLNTAYNRLRGRRRTTARLERAGLAERADDEADAGATPLLDVLRAEQQRAVRQALAALPERQRSACCCATPATPTRRSPPPSTSPSARSGSCSPAASGRSARPTSTATTPTREPTMPCPDLGALRASIDDGGAPAPVLEHAPRRAPAPTPWPSSSATPSWPPRRSP